MLWTPAGHVHACMQLIHCKKERVVLTNLFILVVLSIVRGNGNCTQTQPCTHLESPLVVYNLKCLRSSKTAVITVLNDAKSVESSNCYNQHGSS